MDQPVPCSMIEELEPLIGPTRNFRSYGQHPLPVDRKGEIFLPRLRTTVYHDSSIELDCLHCLDADMEVLRIRRADRMAYRDIDGQERHYTPDLHVTWADSRQGEREAVLEIKPLSLLRGLIGLDLLGWQQREAALSRQNLPLLIVTDHDLRGPRLEHALKFAQYAHSVPLSDLYSLIVQELTPGRLALGELVSRLQTRIPGELQTTAWKLQLFDTLYGMIAVGVLYADRRVSPDAHCPIWLGTQAGPVELTAIGRPIQDYIRQSMNGWPDNPSVEEPHAPIPDPDHNLLETAFLETARGKQYLELFSRYSDPAVVLTATLRRELIEKTGVSFSSLYRFRALLNKLERGVTFDQLVPLLSNTSHAPTNTVDDRVRVIIREHLQNSYFVSVGAPGRTDNVRDLHQEIATVCRQKDLPVPAESTVRRHLVVVQQNDPVGMTRLRDGSDAADRLRARQGSLKVPRYGELLGMDCSPCNVMIVDGRPKLELVRYRRKVAGRGEADETRKPRTRRSGAQIKRATMVVITDESTGEVVFSDLFLEAPSAAVTLDCLKRLFLGDHAVQEAAGVVVRPAFVGLPAQIRMDSGSEFDNRAVEKILKALGITLVPRNKGTKHRGGREERSIGTLTRSQHILPGTTMHNIAARGQYNAKAGAAFDLPMLSRFHQQVVEQMNMLPAPGQGLSRHGHALSLIEAGQVALRQPSPHQRRFLHERMLPSEERTCGRQGVEMFNLRYVSNTREMEILISQRAKVQILYRSDDIRTIRLVHPRTGELFPLNAVPPYGLKFDTPVSKQSWEAVHRQIQEQRKLLIEYRRTPNQILTSVLNEQPPDTRTDPAGHAIAEKTVQGEVVSEVPEVDGEGVRESELIVPATLLFLPKTQPVKA